MALPNLTGNVVSIGFNCHVRVTNDKDAVFVIGFATSASYSEDFAVQKANVLGHFGPVSIDPQDYNCQIQISTFVPAKVLIQDGEAQYDIPTGNTMSSIFDLIPSRSDIADDGTFKKLAKIDFFDKKSDTVLASFRGAVVTSDGVTINQGYNSANVTLMALEREKWVASTDKE